MDIQFYSGGRALDHLKQGRVAFDRSSHHVVCILGLSLEYLLPFLSEIMEQLEKDGRVDTSGKDLEAQLKLPLR